MKAEANFDKDAVLLFPAQSGRPIAASMRKRRIAVVGNYPPTRCGIASFTSDMVSSMREAAPNAEIDIYAMVSDAAVERPAAVRTLIVDNDRENYRQAGIELDQSGADVVWVQHEFGLFGGEAGDWIIDLLTPVAAPLVVTFHTILESPTAAQRKVMNWLVARASKLVVMSEESRSILQRCFLAEPDRIAIIPHGVPDRPFGRSDEMKAKFALSGRDILMTFGLLSPGKGLENVIAALPKIVAEFPDAVYCIAGVTHPKLFAREGEAYRDRLVALAESLGVADHIIWVNRYLDNDELLDLIEAADIYVTPYTNSGQSTSGTLAYAAALGKAIVSTPYKHALELVGPDMGVIVPFADPDALETAIVSLLKDRRLLNSMQCRAYAIGRSMTWSAFARKTVDIIDAVSIDRRVVVTPQIASESGLFSLCDDTGMMQHGVFSIADRSHGYCIDDNARALMLAVTSRNSFASLAPVFAAFVQHGWNPDTRRFRNFMGFDRRWLEDVGSDDSCGRTLWALGKTAVDARDSKMRIWAQNLWSRTADIALEFHSPRAVAFAMLGADAMLSGHVDDPLGKSIIGHGREFLSELYGDCSKPGWRWYEPVLAYDNCRIPEAMLKAAVLEKDDIGMMHALEALDWLVHQQTAPGGHFRPIGSNGFGSSVIPSDPFDQQAVDAWATVDAMVAAYCVDPSAKWRDTAIAAFDWFFGRNDRGLAIADAMTGSCHDGLTPQGLNLNQGAESVLSLHLAQQSMKKLGSILKEGDVEERETRWPASV